MLNQLAPAFLLSIFISAVAYWRGSLSRSGVPAALLVGTLILGFGGWLWGALLGIFFVSSSLFSHYREGEKAAAAEKFAKGHQRDGGQALANGGVGAALAVLHAAYPWPGWFALFVGVMATVTADTWATELGTLSRRPPRLITNGRTVEVGTSGGVSPLGTLVSMLGGLAIGVPAGMFAAELWWPAGALMGLAGGLAGSLFDSLLGATVQRIYYCDVCGKETESKLHRGSHVTRPLRGWAWLNNDVVNLLSSIVGGVVAAGVWKMLS